MTQCHTDPLLQSQSTPKETRAARQSITTQKLR